jgi:CheY-like chemotaxis protein
LEQTPRREPLARGAGELVLLIEDDAPLRGVLSEVLRSAGYRVEACADGVDGIVKYNAHAAEIALVLTNINVPHLSGAVVSHTLRKLNRRLPILILSALSDDPPVENELAYAKEASHRVLRTSRLRRNSCWRRSVRSSPPLCLEKQAPSNAVPFPDIPPGLRSIAGVWVASPPPWLAATKGWVAFFCWKRRPTQPVFHFLTN